MFAQEQSSALYQNASFMIHDWNDMITNIIMDDGFSPAVISKHYAYANIAAYTAAQPGFSERYQPLTGQLNFLVIHPFPKKVKSMIGVSLPFKHINLLCIKCYIDLIIQIVCINLILKS